MSKENHIWNQPTAEGQAKIDQVRNKFIELDDLIDEAFGPASPAPAARHLALSKTYLEDARMRAVWGISYQYAETKTEAA